MALMLKFLFALTAVLIAIPIPGFIKFVRFLDLGKVIYNHQPGPCQYMDGIVNGAEDMDILPNGIVLMSAGLKFGKYERAPGPDGRLMVFDIKKPQQGARPLTIHGDIDRKTFNPHGISTWPEDNGKISVFVVNHLPGKEAIERFIYDLKQPMVLHHKETIFSENIIIPNDVVAVGPRQFYFTNIQRHGHKGTLLGKIELYQLLPWGSVGYYDGDGNTLLWEEGFNLPNGINISPDNRYLYVSVYGDKEIKVYDIQQNGSFPTLIQTFKTHFAVDNIHVDTSTGDLWAAGQPVIHTMLEHLGNPYTTRCESQVVLLKTSNGLIVSMESVYSDTGYKYINGSSIALKLNDKLVVGTVTHKAIVCDLPKHLL